MEHWTSRESYDDARYLVRGTPTGAPATMYREMDVTGAERLRRRIEGHQHWVTAPAVREGRQPAADPEAAELEEILDGVRLYGREVAHERVDGRIVPVTRRMAKRLVDGAWETSFVEAEADDSGDSVSSGRA